MRDGADQQALLRFAGDNRRAGFPALKHGRARVELQSTELGRGMAGVAVTRQHGTNALFEKNAGILLSAKRYRRQYGDKAGSSH